MTERFVDTSSLAGIERASDTGWRPQTNVDTSRLSGIRKASFYEGYNPVALVPSEDYSFTGMQARLYQERQAIQDRLDRAAEAAAQWSEYNYTPVATTEAALASRQEGSPYDEVRSAYLAMLMSYNNRQASNLTRYPGLAAAALEAKVDEREVAQLINYAEADRAAEQVLAAMALGASNPYAVDESERRVKNIMSTAGPVMAIAIWDVVAAKLEAMDEDAPDEQTRSLYDNILFGVGKALEAAFFIPIVLAEGYQQAIRASEYGSFVENIPETSPDPIGSISLDAQRIQNIFEYWNDVQEGSYNQQLLDAAKKEYNPLTVEIILDIERKSREGDPDPLISVLSERSNDPAALEILRPLYYEADDSSRLAEAARAVNNADLSNTGQTVLSSYLRETGLGSQARDRAAGALNAYVTLGQDPTLYAGKVRAAYLSARYAIAKLAPGASAAGVRTALNQRPTRRYFERLFNDLDRYEELLKTDAAAASMLRERIRRQYYEVSDDLVEELRTRGIRNIDDLADWTIETNAAFLIMKGSSADELIRTGPAEFRSTLADEIIGSGSALVRTPMMPRMSPGRVARMNFSRAAGVVSPKKRGKEVIDKGFGGTSDVDEIAATMMDPAGAMQIGAIERGGILTSGAYGKRVDRFFRWFSSLPNKGYVSIADASDSRVVYRWARSMLSRQTATYIADAFRRGDPSQRYNIIVGLNRTSAAAKGLDLMDETVLARVDELTKATAEGTKFAPSVKASSANAAVVGGTAADDVLLEPSNFDGVEKALFGWQTASHVAIPSMRDVEMLARWRSSKWAPEWLQNTPQRVTDYWSLGTLYGLRYSIRNAAEDLWFYAVITGGNLADLYRGRRISTALRETRGRQRETATSGGSKSVQALGMINRRMRSIGDFVAEKNDPVSDLLSRFIRANLDQEQVAAAHAAALKGDFEPMRQLAALALTKARFTTLNKVEEDYVLDLVSGPFGLRILDDLAETGKNINSGGAYIDDALPVTGTDAMGVNLATVPREGRVESPTGDFFDLPLDGTRPEAFVYWDQGINGAILGDGPAGQIAVAYIDDVEEAVRRVVDEINADPTNYGYAWRFAAVRDDGVETFARRKVLAIRGFFSDADGNLNVDLWRRVVDGDRNVRAFDIGENGERIWRITPQVLRQVPKSQRPTYASGQTFGVVPTASGIGAFADRTWGWMGEQYARISREPIFIANYLSQRRALAGYQAQMAAQVGEKAARRHVSRLAEDRAYAFTLSYMDNPQNRSLMAWKVRNVARYYRATEDFYRRVARAGKNYPIGLWRTQLVYDVLDDTGFVYTDDNGDKYFMYPGTQPLMSALNAAIGTLMGTEMLDMEYPFMLGGKVNMLTPSADPNQAFPAVAGPFAAFTWKTAAARFPALDKFNRYVLGQYGENYDKSVSGILIESFMPAGISRVVRALDDDERESVLAGAAKDAMAIAIANDLVPADDNDPGWADAMASVNNMAWSLVVVRFALSMIVPASPQRYNDNVTEYARMQGVVDFRNAFLDLVQKKSDAGAENPFGEALADWYKFNPDLFPYTISKTEEAAEVKGEIRQLAPLKYAREVSEWWDNNQSVIKEYPQTAFFLAPQVEGFSWEGWGLVKGEGFRVSKDLDTFMRDALSAIDEFHYYATYEDYQRDIDALDPRIPEQYSQIRDLEEQRSADLKYIKERNPFTKVKLSDKNYSQLAVLADEALPKVKTMVDDLFKSTPSEEWEGSAAQAIRNSILTYIDYKTELNMITGMTREDNQRKREIRFAMEQDFDVLSEQNLNARLFIKNVLMRNPGIEGL